MPNSGKVDAASRRVRRMGKRPERTDGCDADGQIGWQGQTHFPFIESRTSRSIASFFNKNGGLQDLGPADKDRAPGSESSRVLEAKNIKGDLTRYYIDNKTSLVTRLEFDTGAVYTTLFSNTPRPVFASLVFSDYRNIDGFIVPFNIKVYRGLVKIEEMTFTSVQSNAGIKDEQFTP